MPNLPIPNYYDQYTAKERSYIDYIGDVNRSISSEIESNANKQIAANAMFSKEIQSTLINNQIATEKALYNHTQQLDSTLNAGLSGVSRQLGDMGALMSTGLALLNTSVQESSKIICNKLDTINDTLKNPLYTESRELYNRAYQNYIKGLYEEALEDLQEAIKKNKTDPFSHFLLGKTYLYGLSEFSNVIDLNAAIETFKNAAKYISHDAKTHEEARLLAAEIYYFWGLACYTKANDDLYNSNKSDYENNINDAKVAYSKSWEYSNKMLESLYNLARCKVLTNDEDGAIKDLKEVIYIEYGYCIKVYAETDFVKTLIEKILNQIKKEIYQHVKSLYERIITEKTNFKSSYSTNLSQLIYMNLPDNFSENILPYDLLKASKDFKDILFAFEQEQIKYNKEQEKQKLFRKQKMYNACIATGNALVVGLKKNGNAVLGGRFFSKTCIKDWGNIIAVFARGMTAIGLRADGTVVGIAIEIGSKEESYRRKEVNIDEITGWRGIIDISIGSGRIYGLKSNNTVVSVGYNKSDICDTSSWRDIISISSGSNHTVGLKNDGTVVAIGSNEFGQCNINDWRNIIAISAGSCYTVGLKNDRTVLSTGNNQYGVCNTGNWQDIIAISAGEGHAVGLKADGTVEVTGGYISGYKGHDLINWQNIIAVSAGYLLTVGLKANGTVIVTGFNYDSIQDRDTERDVNGWVDIGPVDKG